MNGVVVMGAAAFYSIKLTLGDSTSSRELDSTGSARGTLWDIRVGQLAASAGTIGSFKCVLVESLR
jgi:hypothetical protein